MDTAVTYDPRENYILRAITNSEFELIAPHLELVILSSSEVLFEANERIQNIYFPVTATASLLCWLEEGVSVEVAMVGCEGMLGVSALLGRDKSSTQIIVRQPGHSYRISIRSLQKAYDRSGGRRTGVLQKLISIYNQFLLTQKAQSIACNRRHLLEQQLCTWLLACFNRGRSNTLIMTQERIGYALGVRRESITEAAKRLQDFQIITYRRGYIELKNKAELETRACECYKIFELELARLKCDLRSLRRMHGYEAA